MSNDLDTDLTRLLPAGIDDGPARPAPSIDMLRDRAARRVRVRRGAAAALLVAVVVGGIATVSMPADQDRIGVASQAPAPSGPGTWRELPPSPFADGAVEVAPAWAGGRLVVWHGPSPVGVVGTVSAGAAYDPRSRAWRSIAAAPLGARSGEVVVATSDRILVWGGAAPDGRALGDGAVYDVGDDRWTPLPAAPDGAAMVDAAGAYADGALIVVGEEDGRGRALRLDLTAMSWRALPEPPIAVRRADLVAVGSRVVLVGARLDDHNEAVEHGVAVFDLEAERWTSVDVPSSPQSEVAVRVGDDVMVADYLLHAWRVDPARGIVEPLPDLPGADQECYIDAAPFQTVAFVAYCQQFFLFDGSGWEQLTSPRALQTSGPVVAGDRVLFWGHPDGYDEQGLEWVPSSAPTRH